MPSCNVKVAKETRGGGGGDCLPSWHVRGVVAEESDVVEDLAHGAAHLTGVLTVNTHVEEPAVAALQVAGVVKHLAVGVDLGDIGASEAVVEDLCGGEKRTNRREIMCF